MNRNLVGALCALAFTLLCGSPVHAYTVNDGLCVNTIAPNVSAKDCGGVPALAVNNGSDFTSFSTFRSNVGLAIGSNVEAWSSVLDAIAGGTWTGASSITTLGTITAGVWDGTKIAVAFGGTNCSSASGICLDNITGFSATGILDRTGSGTYSFLAAPGGTIVGTTDTQTLTNKSIAASEINSGTLPNSVMPTPGVSTLGAVLSTTCPTHQWIDILATNGAFSCTQPAFTDISGTLNFSALSGSISAAQLIAPTTSSFGGVYAQTCGAHNWIDVIPASGAQPTCAQPAFGDISGTIGAAQLIGPGASALGAVNSITCPSHQWIDVLATSGAFSCAQPSFGDISGSAQITQLAYNPIFAPTGYQSGPYYTGFLCSNTAGAIAANTLYAMPFFAAVSKTFTKISVYVSATGTATECELGLYADNGSTQPGALVTDFGQVSVGGTGSAEITSVSVSVVPGLNWLVVGCNGTVTPETEGIVQQAQLFGWQAATTPYTGPKVSWTFSTGALPNPFGTPTLNTSAQPNIYLRY